MITLTKQKLNRKNTGLQEKLPIRILQFGGGNFMRAFVDYLVERMNKEAGFNAGVAVIQLTVTGSSAKQLDAQDNLYTLFIRGFKKGNIVDNHRIISAIQKAINPYIDYDEYLSLAEEEALQFVFSNTTEAGIVFDPSESSLQLGPHINFPAKVTSFLYKRYKHFDGANDKGLTFIPCELIENNAQTLKTYILEYARLWNLEDGFSQWVNDCNFFHNTLVDKIVPGYPKDDAEQYEAKLDYDDQMIVVSEEFLLWVIEGDDALKTKIPFDKIDEQILIVNDINPYRTRKVRILNGAHTSMLAVSILHGNETVKEAVDDDFMGKFIAATVYDEIIPTLDMPEAELKAFAEDVFDRFRNPLLKHLLSSIALNSVSKFKVRVLPSLLEYVERYNKLPLHLVFALAALIRFYKGNFNGRQLPVNDDAHVVEVFANAWKSENIEQIAQQILQNKDFWGIDLTTIPQLSQAVSSALFEIDKNGVKEGCHNFISQL